MTQVIRLEIPYLKKNMKPNSQSIIYSMMKLKKEINLTNRIKRIKFKGIGIKIQISNKF